MPTEHKLNEDYDNKTWLPDWWPIVKSNFSNLLGWFTGHINGTSDRHSSGDIDYEGGGTVEDWINDFEELSADVLRHKAAAVLDHPDGSVTTAKIANSSITTEKIANDAVTKNKIEDEAVSTEKLGFGAVTDERLADSAVNVIKRGVNVYDADISKVGSGNNILYITIDGITDYAQLTGKTIAVDTKAYQCTWETPQAIYLNVNGLGAKNIYKSLPCNYADYDTRRYETGLFTQYEMGRNNILLLTYNGSSFRLSNPPVPPKATKAITASTNDDGSYVTPKKVADYATGRTENISGSRITDGSITTNKLSGGAVTTERIANKSVTTDKLADKSVTTAKLADKAVTGAKIETKTITNWNLSDNAVQTYAIENGAVTAAKLADSAVTGAKIAAGAVTTEKIQDGAITVQKLDSGIDLNSKITYRNPNQNPSVVISTDSNGRLKATLILSNTYIDSSGFFDDELYTYSEDFSESLNKSHDIHPDTTLEISKIYRVYLCWYFLRNEWEARCTDNLTFHTNLDSEDQIQFVITDFDIVDDHTAQTFNETGSESVSLNSVIGGSITIHEQRIDNLEEAVSEADESTAKINGSFTYSEDFSINVSAGNWAVGLNVPSITITDKFFGSFTLPAVTAMDFADVINDGRCYLKYTFLADELSGTLTAQDVTCSGVLKEFKGKPNSYLEIEDGCVVAALYIYVGSVSVSYLMNNDDEKEYYGSFALSDMISAQPDIPLLRACYRS